MNEALLSEVFLKIVNMSISASWLVLAVLLLRLVLKKAPKWVSVLLWGFVAVRLICPFSIESMLSLIPSAETVSPEIMMDWTPEISTGISSVDTVINPIITQTFAPNPATSANPLQILIPVAGIFWFAGIAIMLLYTAVSYFLLRRRVSTAVLLRNNIYQSENVDSPFVLGIIKPKIYLPFQMDGKNLEHVIAHEESHIHRKDHWWKPFGFVLLALHWFNPLMWIGYILLCRDIELACDEKVIKEMDNENRADYTQALVACSVNRRRIAACPLAFGEVGVKERVKSVMNYKKPAFWIIIAAIVTCIAVAVCFLTNPKEENDPNLAEDSYYLLIGADGVESIEISGPNSSGGVINADESPFKKGEKVWLEQLQGVTDLRGYSITAFGKNGTVIYGLSIPTDASIDKVINLVSSDSWLLAPAGFENFLSKVKGTTYVYENEGILGSFQITLFEDGTFTYYEGNASSYFGTGTWKQDGSNITMTDNELAGYNLVNHFKLDGSDLIFAEQNSSNFIYVKVKNGEKFHSTGEAYKNVDGTDNLAYLGGDQMLSLNDVIVLSQKGYDLGWSDFDKYKYYETGSGLYIRVYPINEMFEVMIGGSAMPDQDDTPMYIYLVPRLISDVNQQIDIRDGGVEEFISQYSGSEDENWAKVPMIRVNGVLYLDTGYNSSSERKCGTMDGEITSQVSGSQTPVEDDQSNFGAGYGYQYGSIAGTIDLYMNGNWRIFATEEVRQELQFSSQYNDVDKIDKALSQAILEQNAGDRFTPDGLIKAESHCILGITSKSATPLAGQTNHMEETTVYVQYVYNRYAYSEGKLERVAGIATPAAITFAYDPDTGYTLKEFWEPNGGSAYAQDIRDRFPAEIADIVLDPQDETINTEELENKCLAQAQEYVSSLTN